MVLMFQSPPIRYHPDLNFFRPDPTSIHQPQHSFGAQGGHLSAAEGVEVAEDQVLFGAT
jgi:hypothetical protein